MNIIFKILILTILVVFLSGKISSIFCQDLSEYTLELKIEPSFEHQKVYQLKKEPQGCVIDGMDYRFEKKDSLLLNYFNHLEKVLENYEYRELEPTRLLNDSVMMTQVDGTVYFGKLILKDTVKTFKFYSINLNTDSIQIPQIQLIDDFFNIVFYLFYKTHISKRLTKDQYDTFERRERRLNGKPFRIVSDNPLHIRIYHSIYPPNKWVWHFFDYLNSLPKDDPIIIETGKYFFSLGFNYKEENPYKNLFDSSYNIYWIAKKDVKRYLHKLGLKKKYIFKSLDTYYKKTAKKKR